MNTKTKTAPTKERRDYALKLLRLNPLLPAEQKKEWEALIPTVGEEHLESLITILEEHKEELNTILEKRFKENPKLLDQVKNAKTHAMKKMSGAVHEKEIGQAEKDLKSQINHLDS